MQNFDESNDRATRIGKTIGEVVAVLVYLVVIALMLVPILR